MVLLVENKTAIIFLQSNNTISLMIADTYKGTAPNKHNMSLENNHYNRQNQTSCTTILPFSYFSATSLISNSTLIYMYYQLNETCIGEIIYNTSKGTWGSEPAHISFF